jgi:diguanylate cyclase (GGDEF)-like protein
MFAELKLPRWLDGFRQLTALADEGARIANSVRLRQRIDVPMLGAGPQHVFENGELIAPWLAKIEGLSDVLSNDDAQVASVKTQWLRDKLADPHQLHAWHLQPRLHELASAVREASHKLLKLQSEDERKLAFVSEFYMADRDPVPANIDVLTLAERHGVDERMILRLEQWATSKNFIESSVISSTVRVFKITATGREWFEEQLNAQPQVGGPWWMSNDQPNQKWTALGSRPAYDRDIARAISEAAKGRPLAVLFIDFDNLKKLNTEIGNTKADVSLGMVIKVIVEAIHGKGRAYLHGNGDEFVVLLPNATIAEAVATAQRICDTCRAVVLDGMPSPSVSIGIAVAPLHGITAIAVEEVANAAQRRAKENGKGRVESAPQNSTATS